MIFSKGPEANPDVEFLVEVLSFTVYCTVYPRTLILFGQTVKTKYKDKNFQPSNRLLLEKLYYENKFPMFTNK